MKICVVGNSVGFKLRPPRRGPDDLTYTEILERAGHTVRNVSKAGVMLAEQFGLLDDDVLTYFPDAVIIHHGVIETFERQTVRRWNNAAIHNQYRNVVGYSRYRPAKSMHRLQQLGWRGVNATTRRIARLLGLHWQWQRRAEFLETLQATCDLILKETAAVVIVVGVSPPGSAAAGSLPGLRAAISATNAAVAAYCAATGARMRFVDVENVLRDCVHADAVPDGIHFSALGHRLIAQALLDCLHSMRSA